MSDDDIKKLFEQNGVHFAKRTFGEATTKTVTFACLVKVVREAVEHVQKEGPSELAGAEPN